MPVLLNTAYFPPIQYFALMAKDLRVYRTSGPVHSFSVQGSPDIREADGSVVPSVVYIEACENYQKQSYRNRCHFYAADGRQSLSFPIIHKDGSHNNIPIRDVLVDYSTDWVTRHKRAIISAYRTSAFFEYYEDELFAILDRRLPTLFSLNLELIRFFLEKTGLPVELRETEEFTPPGCLKYGDDYRESIHPKRPDHILGDLGLERPYYQVFSGKYGFVPHLSIMDLLFNEGPDSVRWLHNGWNQVSVRHK